MLFKNIESPAILLRENGGIISDKICSKTNKNNQGQVTNLSEQVIAMGPGNEFTPKFKMDAHENTKINIYEDEDMNIHNNTAAV